MEISLQQLWDMEMAQLKAEHGRTPDPAMWRWSPLDIREFDIMLHIARGLADVERANRLHGGLSFFEAGCGIGTKLYLAKNKYGLQELGWEFQKDYLETCEQLGVLAEYHDLRAEEPRWDAFDIVYIARPFKDDMAERTWEVAVQDAMRPGAVLIAAFAASKPYDWPCFYRRAWRGIWVKPEPEQKGTTV
jgi:SAM-dependent methyltransferase